MEPILSIIGFVVVIKFCIRHRRAIMNKQAFFESVANLREGLTKGWNNTYRHKQLDDIVHNVLGELEMENLDEDLTQHIVEHIKAIKKAREQEALETKAKEILTQIKAAIDN